MLAGELDPGDGGGLPGCMPLVVAGEVVVASVGSGITDVTVAPEGTMAAPSLVAATELLVGPVVIPGPTGAPDWLALSDEQAT